MEIKRDNLSLQKHLKPGLLKSGHEYELFVDLKILLGSGYSLSTLSVERNK